MSHVYVISDSTYIPDPQVANPVVTIIGTVDGFPVTPTVPLADYNVAVGKGQTAWARLMQSLMLPAFLAANPPAPIQPTGILTGTFTA